MASCLNFSAVTLSALQRSPSDCSSLKEYFKDGKSEDTASYMELDHAHGWVLRSVLLCFPVHLQLRRVQGYVFSSARSREGFWQGTSRSIHVLSVEQILRPRALYAVHCSALHESQAHSWVVVCRNKAEKSSTELLVQLAFFKNLAQFRQCEQRRRCLAISTGIIWSNKIINKNYFLYWDWVLKPHCHLSLLGLSHKRLLSPSQLQLDGRLFRVSLSGSRWSHLLQNL